MTSRNAETDGDFTSSRTARAKLVRDLRRRGIRDVGVLMAFAEVPRDLFVPDDMREHAYEDRPLPIGEGQTISQPFIVAVMLEALELKAGERVLEVGAGSGYAAALLSKMGVSVSALERIGGLVQRARASLAAAGIGEVTLRCGDGQLGVPDEAPFDAIMVSAAAVDVPPRLLDQLAVGGRLVAPVGERHGSQRLIRIRRPSLESYAREDICGVQFVPLLGGVTSTE